MLNIKPKIKIEPARVEDGQHPNARKFCATKEISLSQLVSFKLPYQEDEDLSVKLELLGGVGILFLKKISAIPGIEEIYFSRYSVTIWKSSAFEWEDIEGSIITALKMIFGPEAEQVEIVRDDRTSRKIPN